MKTRSLTTTALIGLLSIGAANAALTDTTWNSGSNSTWNTAGNWSPATVPNSGTVRAVISTAAGTTVSLDTSPTLGGLSIASGYTLERASGDATGRTLTIAATTAADNFFSNSGLISSGGTSGTLSLRFNGGGSTFVNAGTLQATANTTLELKGNNGTTLPTLVNTGGTIQTLGNGTLKISCFDIPSGQPAGIQAITGGTLSISSGGTMTTDGGPRPFTLTNVAFTNNGTVNWIQANTSTGSSQPTIMTLAGTTALVNNGSMQFTRDGAFHTFATSQVGLTVSASTASLTNNVGATMNFLAKGSVGGQSNLTTLNANYTITNNGTITFESQSTVSNSQLSVGATGANALTLGGSGSVVLKVGAGGSASNVGIGGSTANLINGASHTISGAGFIGTGGTKSVTNNGTITANDATNALTVNMAFATNDNTQIGTFINNGTLQATGAGGLVINVANLTNNGTFTTGSTSPFTMNKGFKVTNNSGKTMTIGGAWISGTGGGSVIDNSGTITYDSATTSSNQIGQTGSGAFIKSGTGNLTLTGANTSTGSTTVNNGTLFVNTGAATALTVSNVPGPTVTLTSGNTTGLVVGQWDGQGYINGILTSTTYLRTGAATSPGSTSITAAAYSTLSSGNLTMNGGTLDLGTGSHTVAQVTIAGGTIANGNLTTSATNYDGQSGTVSANLNGASKTLTKTTGGTLTLSGSNGYTGNTTVSVGTLLVDNTSGSGTGTGSLAVSSGAVLGGTGTIAPGTGKSITVSGVVAPGNSSAIGTLTLNGGSTSSTLATFASGASFAFDLTAGTGSDKVALLSGAAGDFVFNSNNIAFTVSGSLVSGQTYTLFSADVASAYSGLSFTLGKVTGGLAFTGLGGAFQTNSYISQVGNDLVLNAVPEPATWALLAFSLTTVMVLRRRRNS